MKIIKFAEALAKDNLDIIINTLHHDGVIIYPTDTLYGMGGNFFSLPAMEKLDAIKNRRDLPYSVIVPNLDMLSDLVDHIPDPFPLLYQKLLPGKFTFLFKVSASIDRALVKNSDKIGIRIPHLPGLLKLVEMLKVPLISTSVNRSGQPPLNDPAAIGRLFPGSEAGPRPDLLLDAGTLPGSKGSTILDLSQGAVKCLRRGDDWEKVDFLFASGGPTDVSRVKLLKKFDQNFL
jgi:L-threonylcarbamoyladenylate synthase